MHGGMYEINKGTKLLFPTLTYTPITSISSRLPFRSLMPWIDEQEKLDLIASSPPPPVDLVVHFRSALNTEYRLLLECARSASRRDDFDVVWFRFYTSDVLVNDFKWSVSGSINITLIVGNIWCVMAVIDYLCTCFIYREGPSTLIVSDWVILSGHFFFNTTNSTSRSLTWRFNSPIRVLSTSWICIDL